MNEQRRLLREEEAERLISLAARERGRDRPTVEATSLGLPVLLRVRHEPSRMRDLRLMSMLDEGSLDIGAVQALVELEPSGLPRMPPEGLGLDLDPGTIPPDRWYARALAALAPQPGDSCLVLGEDRGRMAAIFTRIAGPGVAMSTSPMDRKLRRRLKGMGVRLLPVERALASGPWSRICFVGAMPTIPADIEQALLAGGRALCTVGPRFRSQRLLLLEAPGRGLSRRDLGPTFIAPMSGRWGWLA